MGAKSKFKRQDIIQSVIKMKLEKCASQMTILNFLKNDLTMGQTMAYDIIGEANKIIVETYKDWNKDMVERAIAELEEQRESAKLTKDKRLVLDISKEIAKIKGLYIERVDHTTGGEKINEIKLIYIKNKEDRDGDA